MTGAVDIRGAGPEDLPAPHALYGAAFPDEDLLPLVTALASGDWPVLSLVAGLHESIIGHILFTIAGTTPKARDGALLAPLAVHPNQQRKGIGTALMAAALNALADSGVRQVFVLGDPGYYSRAGFVPETAVQPPYPLPPEWAGAWQSLCLNGSSPVAPGSLQLPAPWQDKELWLP